MYCPFVCSHPILYIYFCRIYRISFLYAIQYTQIDIPISPIRLDFRLRFTICGVRARNAKISDCIDRHIKKISTKKKNRSRSSLSSLQIRNASYGFIFATCKRGLSKLWCSHHPIDYASRRSFERILATGLDAIFGETSTGIRPKVPNYRRNTIPGKFLRRNSELGVTRFEGIAFERRRKYRFPKTVLRFRSLYPRVSRARSSKRRSFYLISDKRGMFRWIGRIYVVYANTAKKNGSFLRMISS